MTTATQTPLVIHPGRLIWATLAQRAQKDLAHVSIQQGEIHVFVRPAVAAVVWDWVSNHLAETKYVGRPLVPEVEELGPGVGADPMNKIPVTRFVEGVKEWKRKPMPARPYQVPVWPWIVVHQLTEDAATENLLAKYPAGLSMRPDQALVAWVSPYRPQLMSRPGTRGYDEQPPDVNVNAVWDLPADALAQAPRWMQEPKGV